MDYIVNTSNRIKYPGFIFEILPNKDNFNKALKKYRNKSTEKTQKEQPLEKKSNKVFIVHGHNEKVKKDVENFLLELDVEPIILNKKANKGKTIIEKIEDNKDVAFAVILMTADDYGGKSGEGEAKLRARQNVILELGFFMSELGRENICTLKEPSVEEPSDIHGVLYTKLDEGGDWKNELLREMKAAGVPLK